VTDGHPACRASWRQLVIPETGYREETTMHPMFRQLFIQADADDLLAEETGGAACPGPGEPGRP
jgi:hypothetical protein